MADILVAHPNLGFGGSEATALWTIQALAADHDVTLLTAEKEDLDDLNAFAGTSLSPGDVDVDLVPHPFPLSATDRLATLKGRRFDDACRRAAENHDLCISTYNFQAFGERSIQMVADLSFDDALRSRFTQGRAGLERLWADDTPIRDAYLSLLGLLAEVRNPLERDHRVLANSRWTRDRLEDHLGLSADVLYPPVPEQPDPSNEAKREKGFIALGRVVREKRTHLAIEILDAVRAEGHEVSLTIVGPPGEPGYADRVRSMVDRRGDWVNWTGRVPGAEKDRLLAEHPFAIATREREPFGIAVAETVGAGCIPFVPADGGQAEIVPEDRLTYDSPTEAVQRITTVLDDPDRHPDLRARLQKERDQFSAARFQEELRRIVAEELEGPGGSP